MTTTRFSIGTSSRVAVRTRAVGVLARLAHDLEIAAGSLEGEASSDGDAWTAVLSVRAAELRVAGTLHGDRLDRSGLGASDRAEIERRVRADALANAIEVVVRGSGSSRSRGEVVVEAGRRAATFPVRLDVRELPDGRLAATARATLALSRLGVPEVKGPLGAFKLKDEVEVVAELELVPA